MAESSPLGRTPQPRARLVYPAAIGLALTAAATILRWLLDPFLQASNPFGTYYVAVAIATWYGGVAGGLIASLLSAFAGDFLFVEPRARLSFGGPSDLMSVGAFLLVAAVLVWQVAKWRRADDRLRDSEARLREHANEVQALLDAVPAVVLVSRTPDGKEIVGNRFCQERLGVAPGQNLSYLAQPEDRPASYRLVRDAAPITPSELPLQRTVREGVEIRDVELNAVLGDGSAIALFGNTVPLRDHAGNVKGAVAAFVDITERKRFQAELERERSFLRQVIDASPSAVIVKDRDGTILLANKAAERFHGVTHGELTGKSSGDIQGIAPSGIATIFDAPLAEAMTRTEPWSDLLTLRDEDGRTHELHVTRVPLTGRDGSANLLIVAEDITANREAERALQQSAEARSALEAQLRQSQKMEAIGRLAGGIAHDFNNLLTAILGYSDMLNSSMAEGDPRRHDADEIRKAAESAASLTRQLLAFSRKQVVQPRPLCLGTVISRMENMLRRIIGEDIRCEIQALSSGEPQVLCDAGQVEQVVMNLAVNARDAMPQGGLLRITTGAIASQAVPNATLIGMSAGEYVALSVSDTGCGMSEEVQSHLFEPFFTTKERGKGTGLGLATVYGIVRQHSGFLAVDSQVGKGTTMTIYLPVRTSSDAEASEKVNVAPPVRPGATILVVDDDDGVRRLTCRMLAAEGYEVLEARSGELAIQQAAGYDRPITLLLTDVVMTGMNGPTLYDAMRAARPRLRVLFMSGYTGEALGAHAVVDLETPLIIKPYTATRLAARIRDVLKSKPWTPSARRST